MSWRLAGNEPPATGTANTGAVSEYESLDDPFAHEAIELIADWISTNT